MKILNLYAGIGGNRKLWQDVEVTAIENNPKIAKIYQDFFPDDAVIVTDAHQYLLEYFELYDFIWSSPPCPTHSRVRKYCAWKKNKDGTKRLQNKPVYPDMKLYEEIILLQHYYNGKYCIENVMAFYEPLIQPQKGGRHWFWANFPIHDIKVEGGKHFAGIEELAARKGFPIKDRTMLRNAVEPELGLHILKESQRDIQGDLFK